MALAGGVGGAKLAFGLALALGDQLTVVVNTGDDFEHWGLHVSPDLDTVMYNLAGLNNPEFGWGLAGETFRALETGDALRRRKLVPPGRRRSRHEPPAHRMAA